MLEGLETSELPDEDMGDPTCQLVSFPFLLFFRLSNLSSFVYLTYLNLVTVHSMDWTLRRSRLDEEWEDLTRDRADRNANTTGTTNSTSYATRAPPSSQTNSAATTSPTERATKKISRIDDPHPCTLQVLSPFIIIYNCLFTGLYPTIFSFRFRR